MRRPHTAAFALLASCFIALTGCGTAPNTTLPSPSSSILASASSGPTPTPTSAESSASPRASATAVASATPSPSTSASPTPSATPTPSPSGGSIPLAVTPSDHTYTSIWFAGAHRVILRWGCVPVPEQYLASAECPTAQGKYYKPHHGVDIAMPVGTRIYAGFNGCEWVDPKSNGKLGSAYGRHAFRIRCKIPNGYAEKGYIIADLVFGQVSKNYSRGAGKTIVKGQLLGLSGRESTMPKEKPHLHFEIRRPGGTVETSFDPYSQLMLLRNRR